MTTLTERTARLRTDLRKAVKSGARLQSWPDGATVSVRCETGSMCQTITIAITAPDAWALDPSGLTPAARELGALMERWLVDYVDGAWGDVIINGRSAGSVARAGWRPNED